VEKLEFSCMCLPEVTSRLRSAGRRYVAVAGMEAHVCVLQTCLDLLAQGYLVHVVRDAVCSRSAEDKDNALEMMRGAGAVITTTETLLFQILGRAGTDEFKAISKRIK
jgi:nicotinamidase-related amidase